MGGHRGARILNGGPWPPLAPLRTATAFRRRKDCDILWELSEWKKCMFWVYVFKRRVRFERFLADRSSAWYCGVHVSCSKFSIPVPGRDPLSRCGPQRTDGLSTALDRFNQRPTTAAWYNWTKPLHTEKHHPDNRPPGENHPRLGKVLSWMYTVVQKLAHFVSYALTSSSIDQFSNLFHC